LLLAGGRRRYWIGKHQGVEHGQSALTAFWGGEKSGAEPRHQLTIVIRVHVPGESQLLLIAQAGALLGFLLALPSAGSNMAARIAMIAITTNNSMRVKPLTRPEVWPAFAEVITAALALYSV